jgi:hypothetical protein
MWLAKALSLASPDTKRPEREFPMNEAMLNHVVALEQQAEKNDDGDFSLTAGVHRPQSRLFPWRWPVEREQSLYGY